MTGLVPAMWLYEDTGEEVPRGAVSRTGGLHVRGRDRSILRVALPGDCLGFQIGALCGVVRDGGKIRLLDGLIKLCLVDVYFD